MTHRSLAEGTPLAIVHEFWRQAYDILLDKLMRGAHGMMWWSVFGLLSSSCCAIQLILNIFNFGCAGFNTYLGPLRPIFLAVTITLNARMWELAIPQLDLPSTPEYYLPCIIASTILTAFLSLLPEITAYRNSGTSVNSAASATAGACVEVTLSLEGLGCVACTSAVQNALQKCAKVVSTAVALEEKEAKITLTCDEAEARSCVVPDLISQVETAGFEATLQKISKTQNQDSESTDSPSKSEDGLISAVVAGLMSSSCCLLQLALNLLASLNVLHIGCAGFNKVLGPFRPHLRTLTIAWLGYTWFRSMRAKDCCKPRMSRLIFNTVLCLGLTFLPELLRASGGNAIAPPTDGAKRIKLKVEGMGCEACEMHVRSVIDRSSGVISSRADFKGGFAELDVAENWGFDAAGIARELKRDGFEVKLD